MPTNPNILRMASTTQTSSDFIVENWVDLPESLMRRFPELRGWNEAMKGRYMATQEKLAAFVRSQQVE